MIRSDWQREEIRAIYDTPLIELVFQAQQVHRQYHDPRAVQKCTLLSVKTGGCPEDCGYCPQAARYHTGVDAQKLMDLPDVVAQARAAKESGSTRFCMGAAWREVKDGAQFDRVLEMVKAVNDLGLQVCTTLGMVTEEQAAKLEAAGVYAYNHNIDTSESFYGQVIGTRTYEDRLNTLKHVRKAGMTICSGGIIGMGETVEDRIDFLHRLASFDPHPESVPINALVPVEGTPLGDRPKIDPLEMVRTIATARMLMPRSVVRLSAGRLELSIEAQMLCFMAGANSIFAGDKLLTTPNPNVQTDDDMFRALGLKVMEQAPDPRAACKV
ncbi:MAG: biotin synthase BioB [Acidobacteriota bacterium]|nr:biotin synthase BioB [Acidobacteriota bacterium]